MRRLLSLKALRRLVIVGFVGLAAAGLAGPGIAAVLASSTNVPSPGAPNPINVLPSTVGGALSGMPGQQQYLAQLLYSYGRNPAFWQAVAAQQAGTATAGQISLVQQQNGSWGVPAAKPSALSRIGTGVGGVTTVVGGYSLGVTVGAGTLDILGFDATGTVCRAVLDGALPAFVATVTGYGDCAGTSTFAPAFIPNEGISAGTNWGTMVCSTSGAGCARLTHVGWETVGGVQRLIVCAARSWTGSAPSGTYLTVNLNMSTGGTISNFNVSGISQTNSGNVTVLNTQCLPVAPDSTVGTRQNQSAHYGSQVVGMTWTVSSLAGQPVVGQTPTSIPADPDRRLRCVVAWSGGSAVGWTDYYRESDGVLPTPNCPDPASGFAPTSVQVFEVFPGTDRLLWDLTPTPEYTAATTLAPECMNGTCLLDLRKEGASCFQSPASCLDWFTDPNKTSKYSCYYGTHAVDLSECTVYAPTFQPEATTTGNTYGDPASGGAVANPKPTAGSDPDGSGQACWPSGWAVFNPLEWVYRPIVCAAQWAFVPRTQVVTSVAQRVTTAWDDTLPAQAPAIVSGWAAALPEDVGGCQGPAIDLGPAVENFGVDGVEPQYPLSACEAPWSGLAAISKAVTTMLVMIGGAFAIVRYISATIGFTGFGRDQGAAS